MIKCTVELTRCRLDRTYLEALETAVISAPKHLDTTPPEDVAALREEVDSLYAEIFPVVQMSVENQYLQPAVRKVTTRNAQALEHSSAAVDYVSPFSSPYLRFSQVFLLLLLLVSSLALSSSFTLCSSSH